MNVKALRKAVQIAGGQSKLARQIGVKQGHIWWWLNKSKSIPSEYIMPISNATGIPVEELLREDEAA